MNKEAVLIHGWDPRYYNRNVSKNGPESVAWNHRSKLIDLLEERFKLSYFNLPGFSGKPEPNKPYFEVEDFTDSFASWMKENGDRVELLIGYSFGGVLALDYTVRYGGTIPVVLISPAISRRQSIWSEIGHQGKKLVPIQWIEGAKEAYQTIFSRYYRQGTPFLRRSYDRVVRRDISDLLHKVNPQKVLLIYGTNDEVTPWDFVKSVVATKDINYHLVDGGYHNIGQTHPQKIVQAIDSFLADKEK